MFVVSPSKVVGTKENILRLGPNIQLGSRILNGHRSPSSGRPFPPHAAYPPPSLTQPSKVVATCTPEDRVTMSTPLTSRPLIEKPSASSGEFGTEEDLTAEPGIEKEVDDEMGELSDSLSSNLSISRPTTPSQPIITRPSTSSATETYEPFSLAHKAERILGLSRGSLAHARACLENARDEVRRTGNSSTPSPSSEMPPSGAGMKSRMDRARKAISMGYGRVPGVVLAVGGKEEDKRMERRRWAVDGVLYWQKEVARLECAEGRPVRL